MFRKVWEALFLIGVAIFIVNVLVASLKPYLPILGISLVILIIVAMSVVVGKLVLSRRKFW